MKKTDLKYVRSRVEGSYVSFASNKKTYEGWRTVQHYASLNELQKPEQTILNILRDKLKHMKMLDIGVGAGRTTPHFAALAAEYVAIDYSEQMIKACEERFGRSSNHISFKVCDVRSMRIFRDHCFDFVLFSYNGIDSISHADRLAALREVKRICKSGAFFCFSSHNLQSIHQLYAIPSSDLARSVYRKWVRNPLLTFLNEDFRDLQKREHAVVRDGTHWFKLKTYYIQPAAQMRQLANLGFKNTRLYQLNGNEVLDLSKSKDTLTDHWLYYLANA